MQNYPVGKLLIYQESISKKPFCGFFLGSNQYWAGTVYGLCVYFMMEAPEVSTVSGSGEDGDQTCDPWFTTSHSAYPLHTG